MEDTLPLGHRPHKDRRLPFWERGIAPLERLCRLVGLLWLTFSLPACADTPTPQISAVRDSAGIRIVDNIYPALEGESRWRLSSAPSLSIGEVEPLYGVVGAVSLRDGRIVIADAGSKRLLYFDSDGAIITRVGGKGEGPGEFSNLADLRPLLEDSVAAFEGRPHSYSVFDPDGRFVRRVNLENPLGVGVPTQLLPSGFLAGGDLVADIVPIFFQSPDRVLIL